MKIGCKCNQNNTRRSTLQEKLRVVYLDSVHACSNNSTPALSTRDCDSSLKIRRQNVAKITDITSSIDNKISTSRAVSTTSRARRRRMALHKPSLKTDRAFFVFAPALNPSSCALLPLFVQTCRTFFADLKAIISKVNCCENQKNADTFPPLSLRRFELKSCNNTRD